MRLISLACVAVTSLMSATALGQGIAGCEIFSARVLSGQDAKLVQ